MMKNIVVIFGSRSTEHDISIISALQVINALDKSKYVVIPIYITHSGKWLTGKKLFDIGAFEKFDENGLKEVAILPSSKFLFVNKFGKFKKTVLIDFAMIVCHGKNGEDGTIQGLLELSDIPYSSSGVLGSCVGLNKIAMKQIFASYNIPICKYMTLNKSEFDKFGLDEVYENMGLPVIVKPCNLGSSIGISICKNNDELFDAIKLAFLFDEDIIIEKLVENLTEVNISVLGDESNAVLSVTEQPGGKGLLSFDKKYLSGSSKTEKTTCKNGMQTCERQIPANITKNQQKQVENLALKVFSKLECKGVVRIDFLVDNSTKKVYVNEINTIPGSFAFYLWQKSGLEFDALLDKIIEIGIEHNKKQNEITTTFASSVLSKQTNGHK